MEKTGRKVGVTTPVVNPGKTDLWQGATHLYRFSEKRAMRGSVVAK